MSRLDDIRVESSRAFAARLSSTSSTSKPRSFSRRTVPRVEAFVRPEHLLARQLVPQASYRPDDLGDRLVWIEVNREVRPPPRDRATRRPCSPARSRCRSPAARRTASRAAHPSRCRRDTPSARRRRDGRACSRASSRPRRSRAGAAARAARPARRVGACAGRESPRAGEHDRYGSEYSRWRVISIASSSSRPVTTPTASTTGTPWLSSRRRRVHSRRAGRSAAPSVQERAVVLGQSARRGGRCRESADEPLRLPVLERPVPRQVEESRMAAPRDEPELRCAHRQ